MSSVRAELPAEETVIGVIVFYRKRKSRPMQEVCRESSSRGSNLGYDTDTCWIDRKRIAMPDTAGRAPAPAPGENDVRGQVERILRDPLFQRSERLSALFRFVVKMELAGARRGKSRNPCSGPKCSAAVRRMTRMKIPWSASWQDAYERKLAEYYQSTGHADRSGGDCSSAWRLCAPGDVAQRSIWRAGCRGKTGAFPFRGSRGRVERFAGRVCLCGGRKRAGDHDQRRGWRGKDYIGGRVSLPSVGRRGSERSLAPGSAPNDWPRPKRLGRFSKSWTTCCTANYRTTWRGG